HDTCQHGYTPCLWSYGAFAQVSHAITTTQQEPCRNRCTLAGADAQKTFISSTCARSGRWSARRIGRAPGSSELDIPLIIIRYTTLPTRSPICSLLSKGDLMERDTILVIPYDPQWPAQYEAERIKIIQALGGMIAGIEHFGSTSIPGLA